jgi:membrane-bound ClpP family serine protease
LYLFLLIFLIIGLAIRTTIIIVTTVLLFYINTIMRKLSLFALLGASLILVGCGSNGDTPTDEFASASCNKYVNLMECLITQEVNPVPADQQADIRGILDATKEQWKTLSTEQQEEQCSLLLDQALAQPVSEVGCSVE